MAGKSDENAQYDKFMKLESWVFTGFFTLFCGFGLFMGLVFSLSEGPGFWIGLFLMSAALTGLVFTWRKFMRGPMTVASEESKAEKLRHERLQAIDQLLAQSPPRQQIPKGFQGANLTPKYLTVLATFVIGLFPASTLGGFFVFGDMNLGKMAFFRLLSGLLAAIMLVLASILWVAFLWLRFSERFRRRKILRDGRLVDGRMVAVKSCGQWERVTFPPPDETSTQSRALFGFPWEGSDRQASQFVYDNDEETRFRSLAPGSPARLLVLPADPTQVIWVEATFLPDPLRDVTVPHKGSP